MDQHAADERIRLEELQRECLGPHGAPRSDHSFHLTAPSRVELTHGEAELLSQYRGKVESWGWRYTCEAPTEVGTVVVLTAVPRVAGFLLSGVDLKLFLMELAGEAPVCRQAFIGRCVACGAPCWVPDRAFPWILAEAGGSSGAPPGVHRALASRACRSAIMFGDRLSTAQARTLLSCMAACRQLHICAHGRPTVTSLVSLRQLRRAQMALQEPLLSAPPRRRATQIAHGLAASI